MKGTPGKGSRGVCSCSGEAEPLAAPQGESLDRGGCEGEGEDVSGYPLKGTHCWPDLIYMAPVDPKRT